MANFTPQEIEQFLQEFFNVVGARQYTGARYVPIFGRKGESSIEWNNSAPYEPLTIVLYQGNSYTSRQYVPAGVDIYDTDFWANTGNYNAQVEQYRSDVIEVKNKVSSVGEIFNTLEDMLNFDYLEAGMICTILGYREIGDGGGCNYIISDSGTVDNIRVYRAGDYYATIVDTQTVTPEMFGAYGDGIHNDSVPFSAACTNHKFVSCNNTYLIENISLTDISLSGNGTIIPSNITLGHSVTIDGLNIIANSTHAFMIINNGVTSQNKDKFTNLKITASNGAEIFTINPGSTNNGIYDISFNSISVSGNYGKFIILNSESNRWVTFINVFNSYLGSPEKAFVINNDSGTRSLANINLIEVSAQCNSNTMYFAECDACNFNAIACGYDEKQAYNSYMFHITHPNARIYLPTINDTVHLIKTSLYNEYTALKNNLIINNSTSNAYDSKLLCEVSNGGTIENDVDNNVAIIGTKSDVCLTVGNNVKILGAQYTPGNRIAVNGRTFIIGFDIYGNPCFVNTIQANISTAEAKQIPYLGQLPTCNDTTRPQSATNGDVYFDTTLKKPIYWYGRWLDATGASI